MAYGRLEIYWPDGKLETHMLNDDAVSVGRAEGNTIALDTDAISRYHFSITRDGDVVTLTDLESQNGTYVDGVRLESNTPHVLHDVEEIQVGSLRILFRMVDEAPTMPIFVQEDETQRIERDNVINVRLDLDHTRLSVWPAASSSAELSILNTGDETLRLSIRVSGMPGEWLRLTRSEIEIDPGETVYVLLNIKPPRRPNTVPRKYDVAIEVAPVDQPDLLVHALLDVEVKAYSGFGVALTPQVDVGDPVSLFLHNQGSDNLIMSLNAKDKNHALNFNLPDSNLTLQPGQHLRVDVDITAHNPPLIGSPETHHFIIEAKANNAAGFVSAVSGNVQIAPRFPTWGIMTAGAIALSVIFIGLAALLGLLNSPQPVINDIGVNSEQLAQGDALVVSVDAENANTFDVLVNGIVVLQEASGDREELVINTNDLSGDLEIKVIARNRSGDADATTTSYVYIPMRVESFTAQPDTLVRYVVGTLTIEWNVPGASFVRVSGLSEFTDRLLQSSTEYSNVHSLNGISGITDIPLDIVLYAEDEVGNALEETLTIPVIDPICVAIEPIALHEGPNDGFQQVASIEQGGTVVVTAQDAGAGWLRVLLPGDVRGWGERGAFDCADTFNLSDLQMEMNPPVMPTDTPQPPTASPTESIPSPAPLNATPTPQTTMTPQGN